MGAAAVLQSVVGLYALGGAVGGPGGGRMAALELGQNAAGRGCVPALTLMLRSLRSLRRLDLSHNPLGPEASAGSRACPGR